MLKCILEKLQDRAPGIYQEAVVLKFSMYSNIWGVSLKGRFPCTTPRNPAPWVWGWVKESILINTRRATVTQELHCP